MTARLDMPDKPNVWTALAAPLPAGVIQWRQQGKPITRDGRHAARFVAYIDAQFVRERLDATVPGEWDLHLDLLPPAVTGEGEEVEPFSFKARLQILGVIRESVGSGKDYKTAETDAFKRAAVRFGVGAELYAMPLLWVPLDGDGKFAKPIEAPAVVYARKVGLRVSGAGDGGASQEDSGAVPPSEPDTARTTDEPECPKCGGRMWDNRVTKRNPRAPDWKCRNRSCDGVIWPATGEQSQSV